MGSRKRFRYLEIGALKPEASSPPPPAPNPAPGPAAPGRIACPHCGQPNLPADAACWACLKPLEQGPRRETVVLENGLERPPAQASAEGHSVSVVQEEEYLVVRLNGLVYTSRDADMPDFVREIMERVRREGISPALMEDLRKEVPMVKFRPSTTALPSDGDLDFWRQARAHRTDRPPSAWWYVAGLLVMGAAIVAFWLALQNAILGAAKRLIEP